MTERQRALLLVGSPKREQSNSASLGEYLLEQLAQRGMDCDTIQIPPVLREADSAPGLIEAVDEAEIVVLAAPLYIDSLPASVTRALERIAEHRGGKPVRKRQRFLAIVNCGFPEVQHNETAVEIYHCFAEQAGFEWAGGLAMGMGEAMRAKPLGELGWIARNVRKALDITAEALAGGNGAPPEAVELMARKLVPTWLYLMAGNARWNKDSKRHGTRHKMAARPHATRTPEE